MKGKRCNHQWLQLVAKKGEGFVEAPIWVCENCGTLRIGKHTIRISRYRLDMGNKPIYNASAVYATDFYGRVRYS